MVVCPKRNPTSLKVPVRAPWRFGVCLKNRARSHQIERGSLPGSSRPTCRSRTAFSARFFLGFLAEILRMVKLGHIYKIERRRKQNKGEGGKKEKNRRYIERKNIEIYPR